MSLQLLTTWLISDCIGSSLVRMGRFGEEQSSINWVVFIAGVQDGAGWKELVNYIQKLRKNSASHISCASTAGQDMYDILTWCRDI